MKRGKITFIVTVLFFILTTAFFVCTAVYTDVTLNVNAVESWLFWVSSGAFIVGIVLLFFGIYGSFSYTCKECGETIKPKLFEWLFAWHVFTYRNLYCGKCGKKVMAKAKFND